MLGPLRDMLGPLEERLGPPRERPEPVKARPEGEEEGWASDGKSGREIFFNKLFIFITKTRWVRPR